MAPRHALGVEHGEQVVDRAQDAVRGAGVRVAVPPQVDPQDVALSGERRPHGVPHPAVSDPGVDEQQWHTATGAAAVAGEQVVRGGEVGHGVLPERGVHLTQRHAG